ncbi:hypothetical protein BH10ACI2_BH10ACI2_03810 [soil metagenome]
MHSMLRKLVPSGIKEKLRSKLYELVNPPSYDRYLRSYSQAGEDRIVFNLFNSMGISNPTYLDIGANLPILNNNTYLFFEGGSSGVCVEPDPALFHHLSAVRKTDKCLNIGITYDDRREADFFVFDLPSLNTLSKSEADFRAKNGSHKVVKVIKVPLKTINEVIDENFDRTPDFISIDVEGLDLEILSSLDLKKHRPAAVCVETVTYSENRTERKMTEIDDFMTSNGYFVYADTHINTIYVDEQKFGA